MIRAMRLLTLFLPLAIFLGSMQASAKIQQLAPKLTELSNAGSGEAAYHLGMLYHVGLAGISKDTRKAFTLFKLSAERGDPLGAYKYGCYFDGQGEGIVESDPKLALRYKMVAAEAGYARAQYDVSAHLFANGEVKAAFRWLEAAAAQGDLMSLITLGGMYSGEGPAELPKLPKDAAKSHAYLALALREMPDAGEMLKEQARQLTETERKQADAIITSWHEERTAITRKADEGLSAAYAMAGLPAPAK